MAFISTVAREDAASSSSTKDDYLNPSSIKGGQKVRFALLAEEPFMFYELWGNHVNDPENDPDHFVSTGGPLWLIAARFFYHEIFFFKRRLWRKFELWEWFFSRLVVFIIVRLSIYYGFVGYILNFWFSPALVVGIALGLFFDYLPHRPFQERDRWHNARVYPSPILNILICGQNYHLIHHLWPSIPWYNYKPAYEAMKPLLDVKGSPQSLGLLQGKNFWSFLYDVFLGIRFHKH